jgi:phenylacetate-CoA ligase
MYPLLYKTANLFIPGGIARHRRLQELNRNQWMSPEELRALQLTKIQRLVEHAYANVPFYQQRLKESGIYPNDIRTLEDFCQIPTLTKQDIRTHREAMVAENLPRSAIQREATGGATGEPLVFYVSDDFRRWNWAAAVRAESWYGHRPGEKEAWIWGADRDLPHWKRSRRLKARLKRQRWLNSFDMDGERMEAFAQMLERFQPALIVGYTSSMYLFAKYLENTNRTSIRPRAVETSAEKLYRFQRDTIERVFDCPVIDHYASRELGAIAAQCQDGRMHVFDDLRYLEVLTDGRTAEPGQVGNVVVTNLANDTMPFLRYETGDLAIRAEETCPCGRGLSLLQEIVGRSADIFTTPSGKLISGLYFVHRMRGAPGVRRFQVHQSSKDTIRIFVEPSDQGVNETWLEHRRQEFDAHVGKDTRVHLKIVDRIPATPAGKHLFTLSEVPVDLNRERIPSR